MKIENQNDAKVPNWLWLVCLLPFLWLMFGNQLVADPDTYLSIFAILALLCVVWVMRKKRGL